MSNTSDQVVRIARCVQDSIVDGPGLRYVVFMQGCPHHCSGCHNLETHDPTLGYLRAVAAVIEDMRRNPLLQGLTLSGGEPFFQAGASRTLAEGAQRLGLNVWCYSGYTWEQLMDMPEAVETLAYVNVLVDGAYMQAKRSLELPFRGSSNQRLIDVRESLRLGYVIPWDR